MNYYLALAFTFSILIAGVIGIFRFNRIHTEYRPFFVLVWLACLNEVVAYFSAKYYHTNGPVNNLYVLLEALVIILQFKNWKIFHPNGLVLKLILVILPLVWAYEIFVLHKLYAPSTYFRVFVSFLVVLMSIQSVNKQLIFERKNLLKNARFQICVGFILYFPLKVITGVFWIYGLSQSMDLQIKMAIIHLYVNLIANLIFAIAMLCLPKKHLYTLPS
jgi:hypothetical protein